MINVRNMSYRVSASLQMEQLNLDIPAGKITALLGPNGAGKSTLLKLITGLLKPDSGNIFLDNLPISYWQHTGDLSKIAAVLHQQNALQLPFLVREVVMMGRYPHFRNRETKEDRFIVNGTLKELGLQQLSERNILSLSGGEQQRVHLARVLAQISGDNPDQVKFLFLDEPGNNLDIAHQHALLQIAQTFASKGNCVLAVLHDLNLALQYADEVILLKAGTVAASGKPGLIMTDDLLTSIYGLPLSVVSIPHTNYPVVITVPAGVINQKHSFHNYKNTTQCLAL